MNSSYRTVQGYAVTFAALKQLGNIKFAREVAESRALCIVKRDAKIWQDSWIYKLLHRFGILQPLSDEEALKIVRSTDPYLTFLWRADEQRLKLLNELGSEDTPIQLSVNDNHLLFHQEFRFKRC